MSSKPNWISKYVKVILLLMATLDVTNADCCYHYYYVSHHKKGSSGHKGLSNNHDHHMKSDGNQNQEPAYNLNHQGHNYNRQKPNAEHLHNNGYHDQISHVPQNNIDNKHKSNFQQIENSPNQFNANESFGSNKINHINGYYERPSVVHHEHGTTIHNNHENQSNQPLSISEYYYNNYNKNTESTPVVKMHHDYNNAHQSNPNIQYNVNKDHFNNNHYNNNNNNKHYKDKLPYDKMNPGQPHQHIRESEQYDNNAQVHHKGSNVIKPVYDITSNKNDATYQFYEINIPNTHTHPSAENSGGEQYYVQSVQSPANYGSHIGSNQKFLNRSHQNSRSNVFPIASAVNKGKEETNKFSQNYHTYPQIYQFRI